MVFKTFASLVIAFGTLALGQSHQLTIEAIDTTTLKLVSKHTSPTPPKGKSLLIVDQTHNFIKALAKITSTDPLEASIIQHHPFTSPNLPYYDIPLSTDDTALYRPTPLKVAIIAPNKATYDYIASTLSASTVISSDSLWSYLGDFPTKASLQDLALKHLIDGFIIATKGQMISLDGYSLEILDKQDLPPHARDHQNAQHPFYRYAPTSSWWFNLKQLFVSFEYFSYYDDLIRKPL